MLVIGRRVSTILPGISRRTFTKSQAIYAASFTESSAPIKVKKPIGGFRGGFFGFLLGLTVAGGLGYGYLLGEYRTASNLLLSSVEDLMETTKKVTENIRKIELVEKELSKVKSCSATKDDIESLRREARKLNDAAELEQLELKTHIWGIQQDLHSLLKDKATTIRLNSGLEEHSK